MSWIKRSFCVSRIIEACLFILLVVAVVILSCDIAKLSTELQNKKSLEISPYSVWLINDKAAKRVEFNALLDHLGLEIVETEAVESKLEVRNKCTTQ